ncbi:MAG TPA: type II toxin-antitoxin system HicB family antitoxin [archaeon]|nr:type II toxin-antitoxin system HicB family antitoxin [archaeon]
MGKYFFDIVVNKERLSTGEPVFVAHCTTLGIVSQGTDVDNAMKNIKEAVKLYLEEFPERLKELGVDQCPPTFSFIEVTSEKQKISISN